MVTTYDRVRTRTSERDAFVSSDYPATVGVVLAGGASSRFGSPKGLALFDGETLVERIVREHLRVFKSTIISTNDADLFGHLGLPIVADRQAGLGPLGGIEA